MPTSLVHCRKTAERFIRMSLSSFKAVATNISTIPLFNAAPSGRRNRVKFVEHAQPNWWQVPKNLWIDVFNTDDGREFLKSLQSTRPFSNAVGKFLWIEGVTRGSGFPTVEPLAQEITRSYLFAAGVGSWKPHSFELIWKECVNYFDPAERELTYVLYAPIWGLSGIARKLSLGENLEIRRLPPDRMAVIASLQNELAGVAAKHRFTLWPRHYFVKEFRFRKHIDRDDKRLNKTLSNVDSTSWLNEEVALLRALLSRELTVPAYAFVYDGYPREGNHNSKSLPWRPLGMSIEKSLSRERVNQYAKDRAKFKSLYSEPGWEALAASMRRFAIGWENPFPADALADIIAALEGLLVRGNTEVSYKLRVRTADFLAYNRPREREKIFKDVRDGYAYRSRVAHGEFVFDDAHEWEAAKTMKGAKGKGGNPFHDVNEVHRLKHTIEQYYRAVLRKMIQRGQTEIDWATRGL